MRIVADKFGIDVSYHQGIIDWERAAKKIDFAIIRAGYCEYGGSLVVDKQFTANMDGAAKAGVPAGAYIFSYAKTASAGTIAAQETASALSGYALSLPVFFDMEDSSAVAYTGMSKSENAAIANAFLAAIQEAGYTPGFYSYKSFLENNIGDIMDGADIWVAQWAGSCTYKGDYAIWQNSATGSVDGISGAVDTNICTKEYGSAAKPSAPADPPKVDPGKADADFVEYKVVKNDTLSGIAAKHGAPLSLVIKANPQIKNPDLIYVGDIVRIPCKL